MNKKQLQKFIQECVEETIDEVNALAAGGVSATGGAPLGMDMSDSHELMWSGDKPKKKKKDKKVNEASTEKNIIYSDDVGYIKGYKLPNGFWWIEELIVYSDKRGQGNAKKLMKHMPKKAMLLAQPLFDKGPTLSKQQLIDFYRKHGFEHKEDKHGNSILVRSNRQQEQLESEIQELVEEFLGKKGKVSYYQMGGSLPKNLYNRKNGKPSKDVGIAGLNAGSSSSEPLERDRKLKDRWYHAESKKARRRASKSLAETYYHGTTVDLKPGEYVLPPNETGRVSEKGRKKNLDKVFVTQDTGSAKIYAGRAKHSLGGKPTVYEVEPIGDVDVINAKKGTTIFAAPKAKVVKKVG